MKLNKNISDSNISISYLDEIKYKLAISEISILPSELIISYIQEFVSDKEEQDELISTAQKSKSFGFYSRLNVPSQMRGQNIGSLLLNETIKACEEQDVFLVNTVNPYGDLTHEQLISFYERHGMRSINEGVLIYSKHLPQINKQPSKAPKI